MKGKNNKNKIEKLLIVDTYPSINLRDPSSLKVFLEQPKTKIAEFITGALSSGSSDFIKAGGRLIQGAIKGTFMTQLGREINKLIDEGKIKEDYAESKYGFKSLEELLSFIDSEAPDEERFKAVKTMFFALNSVDVKDYSEEMMRYQLFKITLDLTASQIIMLKISYQWSKDNDAIGSVLRHSEWVNKMGHAMGHKIDNLILLDEQILIQKQIISDRAPYAQLNVVPTNARLTNLGVALCENLSTYNIDK